MRVMNYYYYYYYISVSFCLFSLVLERGSCVDESGAKYNSITAQRGFASSIYFCGDFSSHCHWSICHFIVQSSVSPTTSLEDAVERRKSPKDSLPRPKTIRISCKPSPGYPYRVRLLAPVLHVGHRV